MAPTEMPDTTTKKSRPWHRGYLDWLIQLNQRWEQWQRESYQRDMEKSNRQAIAPPPREHDTPHTSNAPPSLFDKLSQNWQQSKQVQQPMRPVDQEAPPPSSTEQQHDTGGSSEGTPTVAKRDEPRGPGFLDQLRYGRAKPMMVCPHCLTRGHVQVQRVTQKKGVSGGKATGAILTGGLSLLVVGLSRKERPTQAHCNYCGSTWLF